MQFLCSCRSLLICGLTATSLFAAAPADSNGPVDPTQFTPPIRVACLGDSITHGVGAEPGMDYPSQLDRMLGDGWDVRNYGLSGSTLAKSDKHNIWGSKEFAAATVLHPDVVVIMLGTNDTKPENWDPKDFPKLVKQAIVSFQNLSSHPRVYFALPPYVAKKGAFGINEAGVLEEIPMIKQTAAECGAGVIDVHGALLGKDELFKDNVHPSTVGATIIASAVYKSLLGKDWQGTVPGPKDSHKDKPVYRVVASPGTISYAEAYGMIVTSGISADKLQPIKEKFEANNPLVEAKIVELETKIAQADSERMKYKHSDPKQAGVFKSEEGKLKKELEAYKYGQLMELVTLIPDDFKAPFGTAWVQRYVTDRLAPIATTITPAQRRQIAEICKIEGKVYGNINNTPERSIEDVETYKTVYEKVLAPEQKKRVEPK